MNTQCKKVIIKGITLSGRTFRPSDWAQRLTTAVSTQDRNRRIRFHEKVRMATIDGVNCVLIQPGLADEEPMLFDFLIGFGKSNELRIEEVEGD